MEKINEESTCLAMKTSLHCSFNAMDLQKKKKKKLEKPKKDGEGNEREERVKSHLWCLDSLPPNFSYTPSLKKIFRVSMRMISSSMSNTMSQMGE